jgi:hypothetical protein
MLWTMRRPPSATFRNLLGTSFVDMDLVYAALSPRVLRCNTNTAPSIPNAGSCLQGDLLSASLLGDVGNVQRCLEAGVDVNCKDAVSMRMSGWRPCSAGKPAASHVQHKCRLDA